MDVRGLGIDWARRGDDTWAFVANQQNDIADILKIRTCRTNSGSN